jgi:hypothetical protein
LSSELATSIPAIREGGREREREREREEGWKEEIVEDYLLFFSSFFLLLLSFVCFLPPISPMMSNATSSLDSKTLNPCPFF